MRKDDLTIIYYTANLISEYFSRKVREQLKSAAAGKPIISVSQFPMSFGDNLFIGKIGASTYNVYRQILAGAIKAETEYVACAEDDCLYTVEHFDQRPPNADTFIYNKSRWWIEQQGWLSQNNLRYVFRYRDRTGMHTCIANRELLIRTLERRFAKFPQDPGSREAMTGWGEPGRYEGKLGLPAVKLEYIRTEAPVVTFNHKPSLGGLRRTNETDIIQEDLAPWGNARDLWMEIHG